MGLCAGKDDLARLVGGQGSVTAGQKIHAAGGGRRSSAPRKRKSNEAKKRSGRLQNASSKRYA